MFLKQEKPEMDDLKEEKKNCVSKGTRTIIIHRSKILSFYV